MRISFRVPRSLRFLQGAGALPHACRRGIFNGWAQEFPIWESVPKPVLFLLAVITSLAMT
jgi:hypothetical protein